MKKTCQNIIFFFAAFLLFSCNDEFVNERLDVSGVGASMIIISPAWEPGDYMFSINGLGNADFTINSKPAWLNIDNNTGTFINGSAIIHCHADVDARFSEIGIYVDQLVVSANDNKYAVPVYYITEGAPSAQVNRTLEIGDNQNNRLTISNTGEGILVWDIVSMPDWIDVNLEEFVPMSVLLGSGATALVPFVLNPDKVLDSELSGTILLQTNDRNNLMIQVFVSVNLETPSLNVNTYNLPIDFGTSATTMSFNFGVNGGGILAWRFENIPDWLTVSPQSGVYKGYEYNEDIIFTCDRSKLEPGVNIATIFLKTNDPENPSFAIDVIARTPGSNENVYSLEGNIIDAMFNKSTDILYYVTAQPNKLVAYDVGAKSVLGEISLNKAPTCLAISEDFTKAAVGHGGLISAIDLNSYSVTKTFEFGYTIYDMEWANDDWFCYTKAGSYMNNLLWINTATSETAESDDNQMDEGTYLKKVPNQPYVVAARRYTSPSGITVFDISTKLERGYRHQSIGNYWFSSDGQYMYESNGNVYRTSAAVAIPETVVDRLTTIGQLQIPSYGYSFEKLSWIDYSSSTKNIWALAKESSAIYRLEDNDYTLLNTYHYSDLYQSDSQAEVYEVVAHYLFANAQGDELLVLRKDSNNNWTIEFVRVQQ